MPNRAGSISPSAANPPGGEFRHFINRNFAQGTGRELHHRCIRWRSDHGLAKRLGHDLHAGERMTGRLAVARAQIRMVPLGFVEHLTIERVRVIRTHQPEVGIGLGEPQGTGLSNGSENVGPMGYPGGRAGFDFPSR